MSSLPPPPDVASAIPPPTPSPGDASSLAFLKQFEHDLRTPLGTMAAAVELLRDEPPHSETHDESIAVLERQIARIHVLTQALREFSQGLERSRVDRRDA
jgi:signal transduction histidine kinase